MLILHTSSQENNSCSVNLVICSTCQFFTDYLQQLLRDFTLIEPTCITSHRSVIKNRNRRAECNNQLKWWQINWDRLLQFLLQRPWCLFFILPHLLTYYCHFFFFLTITWKDRPLHQWSSILFCFPSVTVTLLHKTLGFNDSFCRTLRAALCRNSESNCDLIYHAPFGVIFIFLYEHKHLYHKCKPSKDFLAVLGLVSLDRRFKDRLIICDLITKKKQEMKGNSRHWCTRALSHRMSSVTSAFGAVFSSFIRK